MRLVALALLACVPAFPQTRETSPFSGQPTEIDAGRASFRLRCSACHGIHAEGGRGPALNRGEFNAGEKDRDVFRVIANGVSGTEMPAFGGRNTEESIWRIVAYLKSFEPAAAAQLKGDVQNGETVFWGKGGCGGCHRVGARGGRFGPVLTQIGRSRSVQHLTESIESPDADLPPGYYAVEIQTKQGDTIRGLGLGYDDFSARFIDPSGRLHSYLRDEVNAMSREFNSLMPGGYRNSLSEEEFEDLLAYLVGLRGEAK